MELPNCWLPSAKERVLHLIWEKAKGFIQKAFTIIFVASIMIWFLQTFDARLNLAASAEDSMLAMIGSIVAPCLQTAWIWRLEDIDRPYNLIYCQRKCSIDTYRADGRDASMVSTVQSVFSDSVSCFHIVIYAVCRSYRNCETRWGARAAVATVVSKCVIAWCSVCSAYFRCGCGDRITGSA